MARIAYGKNEIEIRTMHTLKSYNYHLLIGTPAAIPIEAIVEKHFKLNIEYHYLRKNGSVLGETVFQNSMVPVYDMEKEVYTLVNVAAGTLILDASQLDDEKEGRMRFTLAHELGHWVLHKEYFLARQKSAAMVIQERVPAIEREANRFAAAVLMPKGILKTAFYRSRRRISDDKALIQILADCFRVSETAMKYRLKELLLL